MKARRVVITIELTTDASIKYIKEECNRYFAFGGIVHQVQVNVIKKEKPAK